MATKLNLKKKTNQRKFSPPKILNSIAMKKKYENAYASKIDSVD